MEINSLSVYVQDIRLNGYTFKENISDSFNFASL